MPNVGDLPGAQIFNPADFGELYSKVAQDLDSNLVLPRHDPPQESLPQASQQHQIILHWETDPKTTSIIPSERLETQTLRVGAQHSNELKDY